MDQASVKTPPALVLLTLALLLGLGSDTAAAAIFTVDRLDDVAAMSGCDPSIPLDCSLRTAITLANATPGADEVHLPSGRLILSLAGADEDFNQAGDLDVLDDLLIQGVSGDRPVIDGRFDLSFDDRVLNSHGVDFEIMDTNLEGQERAFLHRGGGTLTMINVDLATFSSGRVFESRADSVFLNGVLCNGLEGSLSLPAFIKPPPGSAVQPTIQIINSTFLGGLV